MRVIGFSKNRSEVVVHGHFACERPVRRVNRPRRAATHAEQERT